MKFLIFADLLAPLNADLRTGMCYPLETTSHERVTTTWPCSGFMQGFTRDWRASVLARFPSTFHNRIADLRIRFAQAMDSLCIDKDRARLATISDRWICVCGGSNDVRIFGCSYEAKTAATRRFPIPSQHTLDAAALAHTASLTLCIFTVVHVFFIAAPPIS